MGERRVEPTVLQVMSVFEVWHEWDGGQERNVERPTYRAAETAAAALLADLRRTGATGRVVVRHRNKPGQEVFREDL